MKKSKRILSTMLALLLVIGTIVSPAYADLDSSSSTQEDWKFARLGPNSAGNPDPVVNGSKVTLKGIAKKGKIDSKAEEISFYYKELDAAASFDLHAKVKAVSFNSTSSEDKQSSFGLMIKNGLDNGRFIAVGGMDLTMESIHRPTNTGALVKQKFTSPNAPSGGEEYDLSITKSGNAYKLTIGGETQVIYLDSLLEDTIYVGLYITRDTEVTFSDFGIEKAAAPDSLTATTTKAQYLLNEGLDLSTVTVTASVYGQPVVLTPGDYIVTGYDASRLGSQQLKIHYKGAEALLNIDVIKLDVVTWEALFYPAKTVYYIGDSFDPSGLTIAAGYNNGVNATVGQEKYTLNVTGTTQASTVTGSVYTFSEPGLQTVTVTSTETPSKSTSFQVLVKGDPLTGLQVAHAPARASYFLQDELNLDGLVLYAQYGSEKIRLVDGEFSYHVPGVPAGANGAVKFTEAGDYELVLSFRGQEARIGITVKEKSLLGLQVTTFPKTTYTVGEALNLNGLEVSKVYDNGNLEPLTQAAYLVDSAAYDNTRAGSYDLIIQAADTAIAPVVLKVSVREATLPVWKSIIFGQSTSKERNSVKLNDDGSVELNALESGGKVTGDHDGISFYYTELDAVSDNFTLSADIYVKEFAKSPDYDGQESFGIMARDAIGVDNNSSVFSSNIAAVGGFSGGTGSPIGTQLFVRTGVTTPDGAGSKGIKNPVMLKQERPSATNTPYTLTLKKTNSGFVGAIKNGKEGIIYEPDILNVQNSKMYVGFYVARHAKIEVKNIQLNVTSTATDAPKVAAPVEKVTPTFDFLSLNQTSDEDYLIRVTSNVAGTVTVRQGQQQLALDAPVEAGKVTTVAAKLALGVNSFSTVFLPDDTQVLTSYNKIVGNLAVTRQAYNGDIYVSPAGTSLGNGSEQSPLDLDTAISYVKPGQTIILQDGTYTRSSKLEIKKYNDGKAGALKILTAAPGAAPVLDFSKRSEGVVLGASYWHIKGIAVTNSADNTKGFTVGGSYNTVENSSFYANGDTGLQISRTDGSDNRSDWPSYNLILNSTSYDNRDPSENNADGFAAKLTVGEGNIFRGCIAHNNIDDGWDLYTKTGTGAIGAVIIENSIAYNNGTLTSGKVGKGDKNGFKLGGEGIHVPHIIRNSLSFGNGAFGYTSNSNPGIIVKSNIAFDNAGGNLNLVTYTGITEDFQLEGFVSYQKTYTAKDRYPAALAAASNYLFDGISSANKAGLTLGDSNFKSLTQAVPYSRDTDGNIIWGDYLKFTAPQGNTGEPSIPSDPGEPSNPSDPDKDGSGKDKADPVVLESKSGVILTTEPVAFIKGYEDNTVRPDSSMTREEVLSMLFGIVANADKDKPAASSSVFKDVDTGSWSAKAIMYFLDKGLINGYEDGSFKPQASITRAEFVNILAQFLLKPTGANASFSDTAGHWAQSSIELAASAGWINGYENGTFQPDKEITRAEAVTIINRALGRTIDKDAAAGKTGFTDLPPDHWAYYQILGSSN